MITYINWPPYTTTPRAKRSGVSKTQCTSITEYNSAVSTAKHSLVLHTSSLLLGFVSGLSLPPRRSSTASRAPAALCNTAETQPLIPAYSLLASCFPRSKNLSGSNSLENGRAVKGPLCAWWNLISPVYRNYWSHTTGEQYSI